MDRLEIKKRLASLHRRKQMCLKRTDFKGAQEMQEKILDLTETLKKMKVVDGGNMYENSVDWV